MLFTFLFACFVFQAHVFKSESSCAAFLSNYNTSSAARVLFGGSTYDLPPWSVSILPDCKTEYYNTAKVNQLIILIVQHYLVDMLGVMVSRDWPLCYKVQVRAPSIHMKMVSTNTPLSWGSYNEEIPSANDNGTFSQDGLVEQISITRDKTDYFWYLTEWVILENSWLAEISLSILLTPRESSPLGFVWDIRSITISPDEKFLTTGEDPLLTIASAGHALQVFVNGQLAGTIKIRQTHPHGVACLCLLLNILSSLQELLMDHWRNQS